VASRFNLKLCPGRPGSPAFFTTFLISCEAGFARTGKRAVMIASITTSVPCAEKQRRKQR